MSKPSIPQGTRDFAPQEVRKRQYIFTTLRNIFEQYGFQPLETPAIENLVTLTGKYGEEGDRLIFKILNNGLHEKKDSDKEKLNEEWQKLLSKPYTTSVVTERALRYDLTIPFARFVVMRQNDIAFPFRRYQMQPVWRADRPQKGRYREFWQCDCDVVGSTSLINEAELLCIYREAFHQLKLDVTIKLNSRKILAGLAEICHAADKMMEMTIILDKLDKIGWEKVHEELHEIGFTKHALETITIVSAIAKNDMEDNEEKLLKLEEYFQSSTVGMEGIAELRHTLAYHEQLKSKDWTSQVVIDINLARGLNYYTGVIVEVVCSSPDVKMGSIGGGGRYDDLTGLFGLKNMSGVGVSFGIDRIYDVLEELDLFPPALATGTQVLVTNFGGDDEKYALHVLQQLRQAGIAAEIYPDAAKFDKQMKYANKRELPYVMIVGEEERTSEKVSLKNFVTGEQVSIPLAEAISLLK